MSTIKKNLKIKEPNKTSNKNNTTDKRVVDNASQKKNLKPENKSKAKSLPRKKLTDLHIVCFRKYLEEGRYITPTEALDRVIKDTGLEISYSSVQKTLVKLRKEMGIVTNKKDLAEARGKKLKYTHIERLKSYLEENKYLTAEKAKNRIHEETGLEVTAKTISVALKNLREELNIKYIRLNSSGCVGAHPPFKLKDIHMEYLKRYLKEDIYIGNTEAMNKLYQDTGLKLSVTPVRNALVKLEQEIRNESDELSSSDSASKAASAPWDYGLKLKKHHIECLKKYVDEDSMISIKKATRRLHNETGLEVSCSTVGKALALLKESYSNFIDPYLPVYTSKVRCRTGSYNFKLQDQHIECLKRYLNENSFIDISEAKKKLYNETGLKVSVISIRNVYLKLKEQIDPSQNQSTTDTKIRFKQWNFGRKLKDNHIECLKKYLNEDIYIGSTIAKNRLHNETGLVISIYPIQLALTKLKKEMAQNENEPQSSTSKPDSKARVREFGYKVKDIHIECFRKYLREDEFIHHEVARNRLIQDTGLKLSGRYVRRILSKLSTKAESE